MKFIKHILPVLIIVIAMVSCSRKTVTFSSETIGNVNFNQYKTFAFLSPVDTGYAISIANKKKLEHSMSEAAAEKLVKKGMSLDTLNPDCLFKYSLVLKRTYQLTEVEENVQYAGQTYEAFNPASTEKIYFFSKYNTPATYAHEFDIDTLKGGSLVIDMIDARTSTLLWRSTAVGHKEQNEIPPMKQVIRNIVPRMFKDFPKK